MPHQLSFIHRLRIRGEKPKPAAPPTAPSQKTRRDRILELRKKMDRWSG